MVVKELLESLKDKYKNVKVYQVPIARLHSSKELVRRYMGEVTVSLASNQNYLNFAVEYYYHDGDYLVVICKANQEQEDKIVDAHRSVGGRR